MLIETTGAILTWSPMYLSWRKLLEKTGYIFDFLCCSSILSVNHLYCSEWSRLNHEERYLKILSAACTSKESSLSSQKANHFGSCNASYFIIQTRQFLCCPRNAFLSPNTGHSYLILVNSLSKSFSQCSLFLFLSFFCSVLSIHGLVEILEDFL